MIQNLFTFQQFADRHPWATLGGLRHQRHQSKSRKNSRGEDLPVNGFADAFIENGGRILIDECRYFEILYKKNGRRR